MPAVEICCQCSPLKPAQESFSLELLEEKLTLGQLIERTVREQCRQARGEQAAAAARRLEILRRQYLTREDIEDQAADGKITVPTRRASRRKPAQRIDADAEVRRALQAFEAGRFFVLADGRQVESLEEELSFKLQVKVAFVRLVPLVGG